MDETTPCWRGPASLPPCSPGCSPRPWRCRRTVRVPRPRSSTRNSGATTRPSRRRRTTRSSTSPTESNYAFSAAPGWDGTTGRAPCTPRWFLTAHANTTISGYLYRALPLRLPPPFFSFSGGPPSTYFLVFVEIAGAFAVVAVIRRPADLGLQSGRARRRSAGPCRARTGASRPRRRGARRTPRRTLLRGPAAAHLRARTAGPRGPPIPFAARRAAGREPAAGRDRGAVGFSRSAPSGGNRLARRGRGGDGRLRGGERAGRPRASARGTAGSPRVASRRCQITPRTPWWSGARASILSARRGSD